MNTEALDTLDNWCYRYRQLIRQEESRTVLNSERQELETQLQQHIDRECVKVKNTRHWLVENSLRQARCNCGYTHRDNNQHQVIQQHVVWKLAQLNTGGSKDDN